MVWGSNPAESHPRHFTKYSLMPKGMFVPNGRKDRTCVIVDVRKTKSAKAADIFLQIKPRRDFEGVWTLRALAQGLELDLEAQLTDNLLLAAGYAYTDAEISTGCTELVIAAGCLGPEAPQDESLFPAVGAEDQGDRT